MKLLSWLHRWVGGFIGILLALLGLSGAILVWEDTWLSLPGSDDRVVQNPAQMAQIVERAGPDLTRITFASEGMSLHQLIFAGGGGAYVDQSGKIVAQWSSSWERPELWLFELHHYLLSGKTGELVVGVLGIFGLLFVVSGLTLWWRSRSKFRPRFWPARWAPGSIVAHHRDLGAVASPLLLTSMLTGVLMTFAPAKELLLGKPEVARTVVATLPESTIAGALGTAQRQFPGATVRRLTAPARPGEAMVLRLKQPTEWTPNGTTSVGVEADGTVWIQDATKANKASWLGEKIYPVHSAKVGGLLWKIAMTASGLCLAILGLLTSWTLWRRQFVRKNFKRRPSYELAASR